MRKRSNHTIRPETEEEKSLPHMMDNLALDAIRVDPELQIRVKENPAKIQEYGEKMSRGVEFTPCVVFVDGDAVYWMSDGIQRFGRSFNVKTLLCEIRVGTRRDALRYALSANENHGDQRTNADRRNAIKIASRDPEWSKLTPNALAELCDVSPHLVLEVLEELGVEAGIIGADGKRYPKKAKQTKEDKNIQSVQKGRKPQRYKQLEPESESNCVTSEISDVVDSEHKRNQGRNAKFIKAEDELVALTKAKGKFHVLFLNLTDLPDEAGPHRSEEASFLYNLHHQAIFEPGAVLYVLADTKTLPAVWDIFLFWGFAYQPSVAAWCQPGEQGKSSMLQRVLMVGTRGESMVPPLYGNPFKELLPFQVGALLSVLGSYFPDWERRLALYGPHVDGWSSWRWN